MLPVWALIFSGVAYAWPAPFREISGAIPTLLGVVMFGMGMTLTPRSFLDLARRPGLLALGVGLQFGIMPSFAFGLAHLFSLPPELAVGLILVGCCPGGTASNVICYLARADVALSIAITTTTTILAVLATPLLMELYAGRTVEVQVVNMFLSIVRVVVIPVSLLRALPLGVPRIYYSQL